MDGETRRTIGRMLAAAPQGPPRDRNPTEKKEWRQELGALPYWLVRFPRGGGIFLLVGGLLILTSWVVQLPGLVRSVMIGMPWMAPINALGYALLGFALVLRAGGLGALPPIRRALRASDALIWIVVGLNGWRIVQALLNLPQWLSLRFPLEPWVPPDAIAPASVVVSPGALAFLLVCLPLLLPRRRGAALYQALVLLGVLLACLSMGRYLYGGEPLLALAQMSIPTAFFQLVASMAVLCLRPDAGVVALLLAPTAGGLLMRRLLVPALVLPPFFGWLRLAGERAGFYGPEAGLTLFAYSNVLLFAALVWSAASWLNRTDHLREAAEQSTRNQLERMSLLQQVTRATAERQDPGSIFQVAVRSLEDHMAVDYGGIWLFEEDNSRLKPVHLGIKGKALGERAERAPVSAAGLEKCLDGHLVYEPDIRRATSPFPHLLGEMGLRAVVLVPLQAEARIFGLLVVGRGRPASFTSGECEFLTQLSDTVAVASFQAELHSALERAYHELRETQQSALERDRLRALGEMASGIAHDINNSISPAALHLESMLEKDEAMGGKVRERLEIVQRAVQDAAHTVSRMQELYRHRDASQLGLIQLNPLVEQVLELTRSKWRDVPQERGHVVDVRTTLAADLPAIRGSESEIREALTNLVLNAVDAMPQGGRLELRTRAFSEPVDPAKGLGKRKLVALEVQDSGIGMDEETQRRCFEPFFTTKGERGSGLGLPMVFGVAERHSAVVEIQSAVGQGTTVRMVFPALVGRSAPRPKDEVKIPQRLRILVVDDDPTLLETLVEVFLADGHEVSSASSGTAGIAAFKEALNGPEPYELVVTDLGMPQIDGRQVAAAVKEISPATPVILLTGWGHRMISEGELPPNFDFVLSKPPRLKELRQALNRLR